MIEQNDTRKSIYDTVPERFHKQLTFQVDADGEIEAVTWNGDGTLIAIKEDGELRIKESGLNRLSQIA